MMKSNRRPLVASGTRIGPDFRDYGGDGGRRLWALTWRRRVAGRHETVEVRIGRRPGAGGWAASVVCGRWFGLTEGRLSASVAVGQAVSKLAACAHFDHGAELADQVREEVESVTLPTLAWLRLRLDDKERAAFDLAQINPFGLPVELLETNLQRRGKVLADELARVRAEWEAATVARASWASSSAAAMADMRRERALRNLKAADAFVRAASARMRVASVRTSGEKGAPRAGEPPLLRTCHNIHWSGTIGERCDSGLVALLFSEPEQSAAPVPGSRESGGAQ